MNNQNEKTDLQQANIAFKQGDYNLAIKLYESAAIQLPILEKSLAINIKICKSRQEKLNSQIDFTPTALLKQPESLDPFYFNKIVESALFDPSYYQKNYGHLLNEDTNLLSHYLEYGVEKSLNPSASFDTAFYLRNYPDIAAAGINPFIHYVCNGKAEGREALPKPYNSIYTVEPIEYIPRLPANAPAVKKTVRAICFYLPQFHAIPENDKWWGEGFTEWTNVKPAKPQFEGHYQPHVPHEDIGYYNLLDKATQEKQIELAKQYGIEGFCYYLYWFSGQRLLEKPLDNMLADPALDFPFCVCWANENWSRRWDGLDQDLLMIQNYSDEDDIAFMSNIAKYLRDPRYITIDGKPLLLVYRPNLFPDMKATTKRWRDWCRTNGIGEIYLAYPQSFECVNPAEYDFDAAIEFPPNNSNPPAITSFVEPIVEDFKTTIYDWRAFVERSDAYTDPGYKLFRSATPSWDNTARKKNKGTVFHNSCPQLFKKYLLNAFNETIHTQINTDERLVFINAWNEWAEGAHLEPDQKYGYAWLQAVRDAHQESTPYIHESRATTTLIKPENIDDEVFELIKRNRLFEPSWYIQQYGKTHPILGNPLAHYLNYGVRNNLNPSQNFDTKHYLQANPDVKEAGVNPFIHYLTNGIYEGRQPKPLPPIYKVSEPQYVPRIDHQEKLSKKSVKTICFYLPQFHAIPENDNWWGQGFTEWTNVKPALPQFEGHYQPHVPDDFLGYYNLLNSETQLKQVELAKQYGIEGFCYYYYWFSGTRLLEQPLENMLKNRDIDFPFCVCWANENWSRRWDGQDSELLITQEYSDEDDIAFIKEVSKCFNDPRYIRVKGKPLLLIYRPTLFPDINKTVARWRKWCEDNSIGQIYLAYPQSFSKDAPEKFSFDAAIEFPPSGWYARQEFATDIKPTVENFESSVYDWRAMLHTGENYSAPEYTLFRGLTPSWDNTARRKSKGTVFHNSCPKLFYKWLVNAFNDTLNRISDDSEQLVFINAWNEWAEGAHLEPDQRYGYAWLQAVKDAHEFVVTKRKRLLVVGHDAYPHGAQVLLKNILKVFKEQLHFDIDVIVLGDGPLLSAYSEYAKVHKVDLTTTSIESIKSKLENIRANGAEIAIVNTTVSGNIVPHLKSSGFRVISLIHELPNILSNYDLKQQALSIIDHSDKVVFPAIQVQQGFETFTGRDIPHAIIRPQGLFQPSHLRSGKTKDQSKETIAKLHSLPDGAKLILNVAYADHRKGFDIFVEVCEQVLAEDPKIYAIWVGHHDTPFVQSSLEKILDPSIKSRLILTNGYVENPQDYYAAADIFLLTSREDPFPSVILESLDAMTPVVAFKDCGGFEGLLSRNCGVLVQKLDIRALKEAIQNLLSNPKLARTLAENGKKIVESELSFRQYLFDLVQYVNGDLPKISVIVPNYNYANYIEERLSTIFNQTFPIYEIIVLDDASKDNSVTIINESLMRTEIPNQVFVNEVNSGSVFKQWQKGVDLARGDYIWIAEADDLSNPNFLANLISYFKECEETVIAFSQSKQIDQQGNLLAENYLEYTKDVGNYWNDSYIIDGKEEIRRSLCIKNTIPNVSGTLIHKASLASVLQELGDDLYSYRVAGDWLIYVKLALRGKIAFHSEALNLHRRHTSSVTKINNHMDEIIDIQSICEKIVTPCHKTLEIRNNNNQRLIEYFEQNKAMEN